ncbi:MAG: histidine phosphatase family protein, partial [Phascolarctobacterium sp.]|nr:histidine phosphatase family protein [Phascolarctobacterium sp.]
MIILVRHGEATHHTLKLTGGWTDSDLTEKGRWQIEMAAKKLAADFAGKNT